MPRMKLSEVFANDEVARLYGSRPPYPDAVFATLRRLLVAPRSLLDAGAGTGALARGLAEFARRIDAVEPSPAMIEAGRRLPGGDGRRIRWLLGRAEDAPLSPPYGLITCGADERPGRRLRRRYVLGRCAAADWRGDHDDERRRLPASESRVEAVVHPSAPALRPRGLVVAPVLFVVVLLSGCSGSLSRHDLQENPAAKLVMPGAQELAHGGNDRQRTLDGTNPAIDFRISGVKASDSDVHDFYDAALLTSGWMQTKYVVRGTNESRVWGWCTARILFRLSVLDPREAETRGYLARGDFRTIFDASLIALEASDRCP